jgi:hypothetical protein
MPTLNARSSRFGITATLTVCAWWERPSAARTAKQRVCFASASQGNRAPALTVPFKTCLLAVRLGPRGVRWPTRCADLRLWSGRSRNRINPRWRPSTARLRVSRTQARACRWECATIRNLQLSCTRVQTVRLRAPHPPMRALSNAIIQLSKSDGLLGRSSSSKAWHASRRYA